MSDQDKFIISTSAQILAGMMGDIANGTPSAKKAVTLAEDLWNELKSRGYVSENTEPMPIL